MTDKPSKPEEKLQPDNAPDPEKAKAARPKAFRIIDVTPEEPVSVIITGAQARKK